MRNDSRDESRQEVTTVKLIYANERPSELLAACAQVSGDSGWPTAHLGSRANAGHVAVGGGLGVDTPRTQAQKARNKGTTVSANGLKGQDVVRVEMIFGVVSGIPPRGRPV
jgi:hypothetical protein